MSVEAGQVVVGVLVWAGLSSLSRAFRQRLLEDRLPALPIPRPRPRRTSFMRRCSGGPVIFVATGAAAALIGAIVAGWAGALIGSVGATCFRVGVRRRRTRRLDEALERQLADLAATVTLAVRSGLSVPRALRAAAEDARAPIAGPLARMLDAEHVGQSFDTALERFANEVGSDDARLFALVIGLHAKTGGDLAGPLAEMAETIRHRVGLRRELRALSAQGRISGTVLGILPVGFFLVLALSSRRDMAATLTTPLGVGMIASGLAMDAVAYAWIHRLLSVEA